jgi:hypothetical protein
MDNVGLLTNASNNIQLSIFYSQIQEDGCYKTEEYSRSFSKEIANHSRLIGDVLKDSAHISSIHLDIFAQPLALDRFHTIINSIIAQQDENDDKLIIAKINHRFCFYDESVLIEQLCMAWYFDIPILYAACCSVLADRIIKNPELIKIIDSKLNQDIQEDLTQAISCSNLLTQIEQPIVKPLRRRSQSAASMLNLRSFMNGKNDPTGKMLTRPTFEDIDQACKNLIRLKSIEPLLHSYHAWQQHPRHSKKPFKFDWKAKKNKKLLKTARTLPPVLRNFLEIPK